MKKEVISLKVIKDSPYNLTSEGLEIWNKFSQSKPEDLELLSIDFFMLAAYCEEMALYFRCRKFIIDNGMFYYPNKSKPTKAEKESKQQYKVLHPEAKMGTTALNAARSLSASLGLSPLDRKKLGGVVASKNKKVYDPFANAN